MTWIQELYETYENCQGSIGAESDENKVPLLPICHTTQKAHVEIVIDGKGVFKRARVVPKEEARTIIPCTESSGGRTSGMVAHPLCDKLQYVAWDYVKYGGSKKSGSDLYENELSKWCDSKYFHPKAEVVLKYMKKGKVIEDLIGYKILLSGKNGKLLEKLDGKKEKESLTIFDVVASQEEAFVRWVVEIPGEKESKVWKDKSLWEKWIKYYSSTKEVKSLCYVTGKEEFTADQHPAKLRNDADKAKLISSNDSSGFTFRGRFLKSDQAAGVGFEVTQKAHSALRWLLSRQGYQRDEQAIVAWAVSGKDVPQPFSDLVDILGLGEMLNDESPMTYTAQDIGIKFRNRIAGYASELGNTGGVVVMGIDSATPGRMAITFYRKLTG
ncbi:MAG: type I-C CRISPR-associated protein Cas8c/Csd1, partial [Candidatus Kryptoniota bacterium]